MDQHKMKKGKEISFTETVSNLAAQDMQSLVPAFL